VCRFRFSLRTMMTYIIAWAALLYWLRLQRSLSYALVVASHSLIVWGLCLLMSFALSRRFGPTVRGCGRRVLTLLLVPALVALLYLTWAHHRVAWGYWSDLTHGFPYPDQVINALERWFDARYPVTTPGSFKVHGEYPRVAFVFGLLVIALLAVTGTLLGLLFPRQLRSGPRELDSEGPASGELGGS
jgi:hypothetical protein